MANRPPSLDPNVFSIHDLEEQAKRKLAKPFRGMWSFLLRKKAYTATDYYNEGAMDLITCVL